MLLPREYEAQVIKHGVTTAVCDPHEMANVVGEDAFRFYFDAAERLTMALEVRLSSCVPATDLETSGARIGADRLLEWHRKYPKAALAELMNVPGVLFRDPEASGKSRSSTISTTIAHCFQERTCVHTCLRESRIVMNRPFFPKPRRRFFVGCRY